MEPQLHYRVENPSKDRDVDELIYYEIGDTYDVLFDNVPGSETFGQLVHQVDYSDNEGNPTIEINKGDVWFRPVPVNVRNDEFGLLRI